MKLMRILPKSVSILHVRAVIHAEAASRRSCRDTSAELSDRNLSVVGLGDSP
jgi:hypothetical protein